MSSGWEIAAWEGVAIGMRGTAVHWTFLGVEGAGGKDTLLEVGGAARVGRFSTLRGESTASGSVSCDV